MKPPKEGSRKAEVYAVFTKDGLEAAIAKAVALELKAGTAKAWASSWGHKGPKGERTPKEPGTEGPVREKAAPVDYSKPRFEYPSAQAAERHITNVMRRNKIGAGTYHVVEQDGKFAVVTAFSNTPDGKHPQFKKGDWVCDTIIPDTLGRIIEAGPQQCEVLYEKPRPGYMVKTTYIPNVYLILMPAPPAKVQKKYREPIKEEPKAAPAKKQRVLIAPRIDAANPAPTKPKSKAIAKKGKKK